MEADVDGESYVSLYDKMFRYEDQGVESLVFVESDIVLYESIEDKLLFVSRLEPL
jgi:hypothetical protein